MKENPERMFGRPEKIDTTPRQSYTDKRVSFMAEQGEQSPQIPKSEPVKPMAETAQKKNRLSPEEARKIYEPQIQASKDPDEIQTLKIMMEEGIPPISGGAFNPSDPDNYENSILKSIARRLQNPIGPTILQSRIGEVQRVIASGLLSENDLNAAEQLLSGLENEQLLQDQALKARALEDRFGFYLQAEDIEILREEQGPIKWLDDQFDILYRSVQEGQELTAPVVNNLQTVVSEAIRWLQYHSTPEMLDKFQTLFTQRLKLMTMRTYIGYRAIGEVKGAASQLGAHGLLSGFAMEEGRVTPMFNRLNEMLDDKRLQAERFHVTPKIVNNLQEDLIQEQLKLSTAGLGQFGDLSDEGLRGKTEKEQEQEREQVRADITRAVRIAYDVFVDSQRQAIIVARGKKLTNTEAYFSDPSSGPLNVYNLEDLLTEKFDIINAHEYEVLDETKLDLADEYVRRKREELKDPKFDLSRQERLNLGTRLFRDLFAVPDFFSSGWRVRGILDSIEERMKAVYGEEKGKQRAKELGLFLRMRDLGTTATVSSSEDQIRQNKQRAIWEKVAKFKPEEIVRLFRERASGDKNLEKKYSELFKRSAFTRNGITNYDQFKEKYGSILRQIREKGFSDFKQLNIAKEGFSKEDIRAINKYLGKGGAGELRSMLELMSVFSKSSINDLLTNNKFEDIYTRTISVDDALLSELEKSELRYKDSKGKEITKRPFTPLSKKWAADQGGDALARNWNDTENAVKAAHALIGFIKAEKGEEKLKDALEFAEAASQYNGQSGRAKIIRFTYGTFLNISKKDYFWDVAGLGKLPLRRPMSKIEEILGPSAKPLGRDEIRRQVDEVSVKLVSNLSKKAREGEITPENYMKEKKNAEYFLRDLEELTEITSKDLFKRTALSILLYLILATLGETTKTIGRAAKSAA